MNEELVPLFKLKKGLDSEVKVTLERFVVLLPGSQSTSICVSEQDQKNCATLIIQLPSKYEGGQHVVSLNDTVEEFDFVAEQQLNTQFSMNVVVLNHDCQHQIRPVTSGVATYLVYSLSVSGPTEKRSNTNIQEKKAVLKGLLSEWKAPGKLIFRLSNEYTQENLSFKNLQSTDMRTAILLKSFSDDCSFHVYLGFLERVLQSDVQSEDFKFNTNNPSNVAMTEYKLVCLKDVDDDDWIDFRKLVVNFPDEVSPYNCFDDIKPYRSSRVCSKDDDYDYKYHLYEWDRHFYSKYYRCPVIVCFRNENLIRNMQGSDTNAKVKMFLHQFKKLKSEPQANKWKKMLRTWVVDIVSIQRRGLNASTIDSTELISVLDAVISFNDLKLLQSFFDNNRTLTIEIIPILISQCEKYGWDSFGDQIFKMFEQIYKFSTVKKYFEMFISYSSTDANKPNVLHPIIPLIIENFIKYRDGIQRLPEVWVLAKSLGYDLRVYAKSLTIFEIVPVLIELVQSDKNMMDEMWLHVAEYFDKEMDTKLNDRPNVSWSHPSESIFACCDCLNDLFVFIQNDVQSITMQLYKIHRGHYRRAIRDMNYVTCNSTEEKGIAPITITKTKKYGQDKLDIFDRTLKLSAKLRSLLK